MDGEDMDGSYMEGEDMDGSYMEGEDTEEDMNEEDMYEEDEGDDEDEDKDEEDIDRNNWGSNAGSNIDDFYDLGYISLHQRVRTICRTSKRDRRCHHTGGLGTHLHRCLRLVVLDFMDIKLL